MLSASPRTIAFPPVFLIPVDWKVTGKEPFCHHLLDFVISRHASESSLAGLASIPSKKVPTKATFHLHLLVQTFVFGLTWT